MENLMDLARKIEGGEPVASVNPAPVVVAPAPAARRGRGWTTHTAHGFRNYAPGPATVAKRRAKAEKTLREAGFGRAWEIFTEGRENPPYEERTITDIVARLARWGNISEKALAYVGVLLKRIEERPAKEAERAAVRAAEHDAAAPVPVTSERIEVEGEVISVKVKESKWGPVTKMLVKTDAGWKVWGTRVDNAERGDRVRFMAKVEPSRDDEKFGFFSRPTMGRVVSRAMMEAA